MSHASIHPATVLQPTDLAALKRFHEATEDDEGYDIGKDAIRRLSALGCVQGHGFGRYSLTAFGSWVVGAWVETPLVTAEDVNARNRALIAHAQATTG